MRIEEYTAQELFELLEMKGKGKATCYVPGGRFPVAKHETTLPRAQTTALWGQTTAPQAQTTAPQAQITAPLPEDLVSDLAALGRKAPQERIVELMVRLCSCRAMTKDDLMKYLKRSEATIRHIATSLLGKRLAYLYPEVIHHPNQAYIALEPDEKSMKKSLIRVLTDRVDKNGKGE